MVMHAHSFWQAAFFATQTKHSAFLEDTNGMLFFQYFQSGPNFDENSVGVDLNRIGGPAIFDHCPYNIPFVSNSVTLLLKVKFMILQSNGNCSDSSLQPATNVEGVTYGAGSRCIEQGRTWRMTNLDTNSFSESAADSGCYQVSDTQLCCWDNVYFVQFKCSPSGVEILLFGMRFRCNCEGEEVKIKNSGVGLVISHLFVPAGN